MAPAVAYTFRTGIGTENKAGCIGTWMNLLINPKELPTIGKKRIPRDDVRKEAISFTDVTEITSLRTGSYD